MPQTCNSEICIVFSFVVYFLSIFMSNISFLATEICFQNVYRKLWRFGKRQCRFLLSSYTFTLLLHKIIRLEVKLKKRKTLKLWYMKIFTVEWEKKHSERNTVFSSQKCTTKIQRAQLKKTHTETNVRLEYRSMYFLLHALFFFSLSFRCILISFWKKKKEENNTQERLSSVRG